MYVQVLKNKQKINQKHRKRIKITQERRTNKEMKISSKQNNIDQ